MKYLKRLGAALLALCLMCALAVPVMAATAENATIDEAAQCSLTLYKYDLTAAEADGYTPGTYVSTGAADPGAEAALAPYAIAGVEFTYVRVADVITYSYQEAGGYQVKNLYRFAGNDPVLSALDLTRANAYREVNGNLDFMPDVIHAALAKKLADNATDVKNALEAIAIANGTAMQETSETGYAKADNLSVGLYLLVETRLPEQVTTTTDPFLVSLPMTTADGAEWMYDITLYPKNQTGNPTLEKTLRESKADTGKNEGTAAITDGYAHTGTASEGDVIEYQFLSTLPTITSDATALSIYTFEDVLSKGLTYNKNDVVLEFFSDDTCTVSIARWTEKDETAKFTVTYGDGTMTIAMTEAGLKEINSGTGVHGAASTQRGYSRCTLRVTYACTLESCADAVLGDAGNPNSVTLTWQRTNHDYWDTLTDDAHVYTYGLDLTKLFSDNKGDYSQVEFLVHNDTDGYYVQAALDKDSGIYYVTGHAAAEADATHFIPVTSGGKDGKIILKGLEDDTYTITEVHTAEGYTLLKDAIRVEISTGNSGSICTVCGKEGLSASAKVNGDTVAMAADASSVSALVPFTVTNSPKTEIPPTGDNSMLLVLGAAAQASLCGMLLVMPRLRKKH